MATKVTIDVYPVDSRFPRSFLPRLPPSLSCPSPWLSQENGNSYITDRKVRSRPRDLTFIARCRLRRFEITLRRASGAEVRERDVGIAGNRPLEPARQLTQAEPLRAFDYRQTDRSYRSIPEGTRGFVRVDGADGLGSNLRSECNASQSDLVGRGRNHSK